MTSGHYNEIPSGDTIDARGLQLFEVRLRGKQRDTDRLFLFLMLLQWVGGVVLAMLSPYTWAGDQSQIHLHLWSACLLGGAITSLPVAFAAFYPGRPLTRHVIAAAQVLWSALLIHLSGGRIETHFHIFVSLAFLAFYYDGRVLITATLLVAADHLIRGIYWPESVYGVLTASPWRVVEHAAWVVFEDIGLLISIRGGLAQMRDLARQQAVVEQSHQQVEVEVRHRTQQLRHKTHALEAAQESLAANEERLQLATRGTSDGLWDWNIELDKLWLSERFLQLIGRPGGEPALSFAEWQGLVHEEDRVATAEALDRHLAADAPYDVQFRLQTKPGEHRWFRVRGKSIRDENGRAVRMAGAMQDVTEHKQSAALLADKEGELRQSQKMEAVGQLAGGVAHEFNNLLQAIRGYAGFAMDGLDEGDPRHDDLREVISVTDRAASLTRGLLGYSRRQALRTVDVSANDIVADAMKLLRPLLGENVDVQLKLAEEAVVIHADPGLLQQVLMNLCLNARDAMPQGGQLLVRLEATLIGEEYCQLHANFRPGRYALLTVTDTGCGMTAEVLRRIFEPFFTTKEVGKGTGLGLSMVYGIVCQHQGVVHAYSEVGLGTTIRVYLPTCEGAAVKRTDPDFAMLQGGGELILIAEDEPLVRNVAVRILSSAGYETLAVENGQQAVEAFRRHADRVALLLLDVVMPAMDGHDAYRCIRELNPQVRAVFCTGYDPDAAQVVFASQQGLPIIEKPFDSRTLLRTVRSTLDARPPTEAAPCPA